MRNILDFPEQFSPKAEIVTLDRNYRSTQPILSAANGVIDLVRERFSKNLWTDRTSSAKPRLVAVRDEADQARYIVEQILENREEGALLKQQAVLFRTCSHSGPLEVELARRNIPFVKFGGLKFLDAAHVKDVLALLRLRKRSQWEPVKNAKRPTLSVLLDGVGGYRTAASSHNEPYANQGSIRFRCTFELPLATESESPTKERESPARAHLPSVASILRSSVGINTGWVWDPAKLLLRIGYPIASWISQTGAPVVCR